MKPCDARNTMQATLVDLHYGLLQPEAERAARAHVAACPACAADLKELALLSGSMRAAEAFPREGEVDWDGFARATVSRALSGAADVAGADAADAAAALAGAGPAARRAAASRPAGIVVPFERLRGLFTAPARPAWAAAAAAALVLVTSLGLIGSGLLPVLLAPGAPAPGPGATRPEPAAEVLMPQANLDNLTVSLARQNTAEYLRQTRAVLVTLLDVNIDCDKEKVDVSAERAKATELLRRQRLIAAELHRMPLARAQDVCNDLEKLLLEVASLADCTRNDEIQTLRDQIERKQIFVRMELLGQELSRGEGPRA